MTITAYQKDKDETQVTDIVIKIGHDEVWSAGELTDKINEALHNVKLLDEVESVALVTQS